MAEETPELVEKAHRFFDLISIAHDYAQGKDPLGIDAFLIKAARGGTKMRADRMENWNPARIARDIKEDVEKAGDVIEEYEKSQRDTSNKSNDMAIQSNIVTPEDASKVDGEIIMEVTASLTPEAKDIDPKELMDGREEDRREDSVSKREILPGNMHTEMSKMLLAKGNLKEVSLNKKEADELSGLFGKGA
jgi:hypothetical protein